MDTIVIEHLTKRYGEITAVDDLSFSAGPGRVTGFLGPNGAGKTTTLRSLLGLVRPTAGSATFGGTRFQEMRHPARQVGAVLDAGTSFHPGRRARDHLAILAVSADVPRSRVDEVLDLVDLTPSGHRRVGGFSMGMHQRLALAGALLGDPQVLVLDEPANALDPDGVRWLRRLLRSLADEGRTVLVSSHLLAEVEQTADDVVVVASGRAVASGTLDSIRSMGGAAPAMRIRTPQPDELRAALHAAGLVVTSEPDGALLVDSDDPDRIGRAIASTGLVVYEMQALGHRLEDVFLELTRPTAGGPR